MRTRFKRLLALLLVLSCLPVCLPTLALADTQTLRTAFDSPVRSEPLVWDFPFADELFTLPATVYRQALAQSSLGLAASAFRAPSSDLQHKDDNIRGYLTQAGFTDLVSEQYDIEPSQDTIATMIGQKTIAVDGEAVTLVAVGVSGAGYKNEWLGNFAIGSEDFHAGFSEAAQLVFQRTADYLANRVTSGRVKVWISGYSRAAAVSNITGYLLQTSGKVPVEDLYVYTFATPNCTRIAESADCPSIFNIVGSFDPVASVPFEEWGYGRFGTTLHLPAQETTFDYAQRRAAVEPIYRQLTGMDYWNNPDANWAIKKICQMMDDMASTPLAYKTVFQSLFIRVWSAGGLFDRLKTAVGVTQESNELLERLESESYDARYMFGVMLYDYLRQKTGQIPDCWTAPVSLVVNLVHEHCPDVYVAWMFSQDDPDRLFVDQTGYRSVFYDASMTCEVETSEGEPVTGLFSTALGDEMMLTLPAGQACRLTLTATRTLSDPYLMVSESLSAAQAERTLAFHTAGGVPAEAGEAWVLTVPAALNEPSASTQLLTPFGVEPPELDTNELAAYLGDGSGFQMALLNINYSGDTAKDFLQTALIILAIALILLLTLIVLLIVWAVRRHGKRKRERQRAVSPLDS